MTRLNPGEARVEYVACRHDIHILVADRFYTLAGAYRKIKSEGRITMSYSSFTRLYYLDRDTSYFEKNNKNKIQSNTNHKNDQKKDNQYKSKHIIGKKDEIDKGNPDSYINSELI